MPVMHSYSFITRRPSAPILSVLVAVILASLVFGISGSSAQTEDEGRLARSGPNRASQLEDDLANAETIINALEQQLAISRQAVLNGEVRIQTQRATIEAMQQTEVLSAAITRVDSGFDQWTLGYDLGGGGNVGAFEHIILPCESGGEPDPDAAIGPTDDWGRAQINRPTWSDRFEELTGLTFEAHILDPVLNGYMAAVVEQEHSRGLNAWTCWRKR